MVGDYILLQGGIMPLGSTPPVFDRQCLPPYPTEQSQKGILQQKNVMYHILCFSSFAPNILWAFGFSTKICEEFLVIIFF